MRVPGLRPRRPRYADVASTLALLLALGGTAYAATSLAPNSVGSAELKADAVGSSEIQADAVRGSEVASESLTLADIRGANATGELSFSLGTWDCDILAIPVKGAKAGQVALLTFSDPLPEGVSTSAPSVADGKVTLQFCNGDTAVETPIEVTEAAFRIVTFG